MVERRVKMEQCKHKAIVQFKKMQSNKKIEDYLSLDDKNLERIINKSTFSEVKEAFRRRKKAECILYISEIDKEPIDSKNPLTKALNSKLKESTQSPSKIPNSFQTIKESPVLKAINKLDRQQSKELIENLSLEEIEKELLDDSHLRPHIAE